MIRSDQLFRDKENSMDNYIFLTDEGYTFQPDSESDVPDIENLQVIGISNGENEKEAFYNLMGQRGYLISTTFDKIFCYKLCSNYKDSCLEFSIKDDYDIKVYNHKETNRLISKIREDMDLDITESHMVLKSIFNMVNSKFSIAEDIIINERYCNYYLYVSNYYELSCRLYDDEGLWGNKAYCEDLNEFLLKEHNEIELMDRFKTEGWFIEDGFALCLDDDVITEIKKKLFSVSPMMSGQPRKKVIKQRYA